jgi:hypothetical protein
VGTGTALDGDLEAAADVGGDDVGENRHPALPRQDLGRNGDLHDNEPNRDEGRLGVSLATAEHLGNTAAAPLPAGAVAFGDRRSTSDTAGLDGPGAKAVTGPGRAAACSGG